MDDNKRKKKKEAYKPRPKFINRLINCLRASAIGEVSEGDLDDKEDLWVELKVDGHIFSFEFENSGEKLERIGLFKEVWQVVDQEQIFAAIPNRFKEEKPFEEEINVKWGPTFGTTSPPKTSDK